MISPHSPGRNLGRRPRLRVALLAMSAAALTATLLTAPTSAHPPVGAARPAGGGTTAAIPGSGGGAVEVTLITGDQVELSPTAGGGYGVATEPAPRPDGSTPLIEVSAAGPEGIYALPADALPYVEAGLLDRELFNVTKLARYGYHDRVNVIMSEDLAGPPAAAAPGVTAAARLSSIDAVAAAVEPDGRWWREFSSGADDRAGGTLRGAAAGEVTKVWLDEQVQVDLDESVPQIGAPDGWAAGFDGTGVTVAVIDTGIDPDHPDVADRIAASRSFVPDEDVTDGHGHGTHVASTVAGSGAASGGQYVGVAPGAELVIGKALNNAGTGLMSQVIDAMEWAVLEHGADVVNLSLGSEPTDGTDPGSQAVNDLTAATGALFVIAAGNSGPSAFTVTAPGAATDALTVGSVDKSGALAGTSGRGPRVGDHAIKPEITGPGVGITAARAAGTSMGTPVDDFYTTASGTSMATPHVAGAAAILAQQHPDWDATALKAALVATAADGGYTVYEQGAGRVDVARAVAQDIGVAPATADFGFLPWPQEGPPLVRTLTYANHGDQPVTLDLAAGAATTGGDPVPEDAVSLDVDTVTLAAGGTAEVTVTLDHTGLGAGSYTGGVVATASGGLRLTSPLGFTIGEPLYTLSIDMAERAAPAFRHINVSLWGVDGSLTGELATVVCPCPDGAEFVVPQGVYHVRAWASWEGDGGERHIAALIDPEVHVTGDTGIVLDANQAERISVETAQPTEPLAVSAASVFRSSADGSHRLIATITGAGVLDWWLTPTDAVTQGEFYTASHWLLGAPVEEDTPPYVYQLKLYQDGRVPDSLHYRFEDDELAVVDNYLHADQPDTPMRLTWFRWRPSEFAVTGINLPTTGPVTVREYAGPLSASDTHDRRLTAQPPVGFFPENAIDVFDQPARHVVRWNTRPFAVGAIALPATPFLSELTLPFPLWVCVACRQGDNFYPFLHQTSTEPRHTLGRFGTPFDEFFGLAEVRLYRDGEEITPAPPFIGAFNTYELGAEAAQYRLTLEAPDVVAAWDFSSSTVTEEATPPGLQCPETAFADSTTPCQPQPLIFLRYDAGLDLLNTAPAPGAHRLQVTAYRQAAGGPPLAGLRLWFSTDGGNAWTPVPDLRESHDGTFTGTVYVPPVDRTSGTVSLRAEAWDVDGNRVEQTILDAYGLSDRTGDS